MTRYEELCQAYFAIEPRLVAIDAIFRELPSKMRQALSDDLQVPPSAAAMPTQMAEGQPTPYVGLYVQKLDHSGQNKWKPCAADDALQVDDKGICHFTIGICLERTPGAMLSSMNFLEFTIESVDEEAAKLQFVKNGHKISINLRSPTGYAEAATQVTTYLLESLRDPTAQGYRRSIGF